LQVASYNMQQATCNRPIKVARKWAAPRPWWLSSGTRSVSKRLNKTTYWADSIDCMVPCCKFPRNTVHAQYYANEACKTCASVAGHVASFIGVVIVSCKFLTFIISCNRAIHRTRSTQWAQTSAERQHNRILISFSSLLSVIGAKILVLVLVGWWTSRWSGSIVHIFTTVAVVGILEAVNWFSLKVEQRFFPFKWAQRSATRRPSVKQAGRSADDNNDITNSCRLPACSGHHVIFADAAHVRQLLFDIRRKQLAVFRFSV